MELTPSTCPTGRRPLRARRRKGSNGGNLPLVKDEVVFGSLVAAFAAFTTLHVLLAARLAVHRPRYRAALALVLAPLAPYWGWRAGLRRHVVGWFGALGAYALVLTFALR